MGGSSSATSQPVPKEYDEEWRQLDWDNNANVKKSLSKVKPRSEQVTKLRFLLYGPAGAGKSSIINSINSTFQGRINTEALASAGKTDQSFTKAYITHEVEDKDGTSLPFVFNDIMGLEGAEKNGALVADIISAMEGHVKDGYIFNPLAPMSKDERCGHYNSSPTPDKKAHCLVSVIPADKIILKDPSFNNAFTKMKAIREAASDLGIPQAVFMTHVDTCCPLVKNDLKRIYRSKKIKEAMQLCSLLLGVPMNCIFPVKNYHDENRVTDEIDCLILEALDQIVNFANNYVKKIK